MYVHVCFAFRNRIAFRSGPDTVLVASMEVYSTHKAHTHSYTPQSYHPLAHSPFLICFAAGFGRGGAESGGQRDGAEQAGDL